MRTMLKWGPYRFGLQTANYQKLVYASQYNWSMQNRIGSISASQYTGPSNDKITLSGVIFPQFQSGHKQLESLRALAAQGQPQLLVDSLGKIHGYWFINSIDETQSQHESSGMPKRQEFTIAMTYYGDMNN